MMENPSFEESNLAGESGSGKPMDSELSHLSKLCFHMNLLFWNCKDAASDNFIVNLVDLSRMHDPCVVILVELKVSSIAARSFIRWSRLNQVLVAEAQVFSRGIWVLWDDQRIHVEKLAIHNQIITVVVMENNQFLGSLCFP